jgi:hypothetical protein
MLLGGHRRSVKDQTQKNKSEEVSCFILRELAFGAEKLEFENLPLKLGVLVYVCNPSTQEVETGGFQVQGQPELHSKTLSQGEREREREKGENLALPPAVWVGTFL